MTFSEHSLINDISKYVRVGKNGIGDDCASVPGFGSDSIMVVSTDMLVENTHFVINEHFSWHNLGIKAAAANVSDISAMGAKPRYVLVSIAIPATITQDRIQELYRGMNVFFSQCDTTIIGGDTVKSDKVCINICIIGEKRANTPSSLRSDLKPGDYLYVTGDLGKARTGLCFILNLSHNDGFTNDFISKSIASHFHPIMRNDFARFLSNNFNRIGMIDISDSLFNECNLLSESSQQSIQISLPQIPINKLAKIYCDNKRISAEFFALFSGEEYELLFGIDFPPEKLSALMNQHSITTPVTHIGIVSAGSGVQYFDKDNNEILISNETFRHF